MNEKQLREQFEKWARTEGMRMRRDRELGRYMHPETEGAWRAFRSREDEVQALRAALSEVTEDLASEIIAKHGPIQTHPDTVRSFDREMEPVRRARKLLAGGEEGEAE